MKADVVLDRIEGVVWHIPHMTVREGRALCAGCGVQLAVRVSASHGAALWGTVTAVRDGWQKGARLKVGGGQALGNGHASGACPACDRPIAFDYSAGEAPPPPVACPFCEREHQEADEEDWGRTEDGEDREATVHHCPCGALRWDGVWYGPMPKGGGPRA